MTNVVDMRLQINVIHKIQIKIVIVLLLLAGNFNNMFANNYYISTSGADTFPGTTSLPFLTIQKGVDMANAGDVIVVKDGIYGPISFDTNSFSVNINKAGNSSHWFTLKAEHKWGAILDCQLSNHSYINLDNHSAYWIIDGFDIRNGYSGGIWSNSSGGQNIIIIHNHIHNIGNRVDITQYGIAGIYTNASALNFVIDGNVINDVGRTNSYTNSFDHGIYSHGNLIITNNVFYNSLNGWHIQTAVGFSGLIANNTFYGPNMYSGSLKVGQIILWDSAGGNITIQNNIFYNPNITALYDYGFTCPLCTITNNIIYGSGVTLGAPSGSITSNNMLNTDPSFVNMSTYDFHLNPSSPAIDMGLILSSVTDDFDGNTRPQGAGYDIGAFEYLSGTMGITENQINNMAILIYPNPFISQTTITFRKEQNHINIGIIDLFGKKIKTINFSGTHLKIEKGEMKPGIYFVNITGEKKNIARKIMIIQ